MMKKVPNRFEKSSLITFTLSRKLNDDECNFKLLLQWQNNYCILENNISVSSLWLQLPNVKYKNYTASIHTPLIKLLDFISHKETCFKHWKNNLIEIQYQHTLGCVEHSYFYVCHFFYFLALSTLWSWSLWIGDS
jgi:hypothetical protein